jgi:hypothetical protein
MSNLSTHLRCNWHHIFFLTKEQPCIQLNLHLHDEQPFSKDKHEDQLQHCNIIWLQHALFIGFTVGKTLTNGDQKWLQIRVDYWLQIPWISGFYYSRLPILSDYQSTFIQSSVNFHMTFSQPLVNRPLDILSIAWTFEFHHKEYNNPTFIYQWWVCVCMCYTIRDWPLQS